MMTHGQKLLLMVAKAIVGELNRQGWDGEPKTNFLEVARAALKAVGREPRPVAEEPGEAQDLGRGITYLCAPGEVRLDEQPWLVEMLDEHGNVLASGRAMTGEIVDFHPPVDRVALSVVSMRFTSALVPTTPIDHKLEDPKP